MWIGLYHCLLRYRRVKLALKTQSKTIKIFDFLSIHLPEVESRTQGSRPRTQAQVFSKKKSFFKAISKKGLQKNFFRRIRSSKIFFQAIFTGGKQKKFFANFLRGFWRFPAKFPRFKKIVLSSSRGLEASRPRTSISVLEDSSSAIYNILIKFRR